MPDTMIQEATPAQDLLPASTGIMDGYRSNSIGKLVAARAKASAKIKGIVKAKKATVESRKEGARSYSYQYADLADVLEAVEEAISEQGMAIFQITQDRGRDGTYLITTLAHESDQWMAAEIRLKSADQGPQVYGSEMTYLRRYAVLAALALAPEADDDGRAAQDRTDQARHSPAQRVEQPRRSDAAEKASQAIQQPSSESEQPVHRPIVGDLKSWGSDAWDLLVEKPYDYRQKWLEMHKSEIGVLKTQMPRWAESFIEMIDSPDEGDRQ